MGGGSSSIYSGVYGLLGDYPLGRRVKKAEKVSACSQESRCMEERASRGCEVKRSPTHVGRGLR